MQGENQTKGVFNKIGKFNTKSHQILSGENLVL